MSHTCIRLSFRGATAAATLGFALVTFSVLAADAPAAPPSEEKLPTFKEIQEVWENRKSKIKSFQYTCTYIKIIGEDSPDYLEDPFGAKPEKKYDNSSALQKGTIDLKFSNGKAALRWHWIDPPGKQVNVAKETLLKAAFDGTTNKRLMNSPGWIPKGEIRHQQEPFDDITGYTNQEAIWMATSPSDYLERNDHTLENGRVSPKRVPFEGMELIEITIPRKSSPGWSLKVYVDPKREYVPVRTSMLLKDKLMRESTIHYKEDAQAGWVVSDWKIYSFIEPEKPDNTFVGTVTKCSINPILKDDEFKLDFPTGTHFIVISKDDKRLRFIQEDGGKTREISVGEFGAVPGDKSKRKR